MEGLVKQVIGHKMIQEWIFYQSWWLMEFPQHFLMKFWLKRTKYQKLAESDLVGRRDLRDQLIVTIDGEDAKDLDDAVTVQKLANGNFFLGVHIADVSYYVTEGSQLDMEAYERGTSVFDRPSCANDSQRLSNGICSLNPHVPRLTMSCEMEITPEGDYFA